MCCVQAHLTGVLSRDNDDDDTYETKLCKWFKENRGLGDGMDCVSRLDTWPYRCAADYKPEMLNDGDGELNGRLMCVRAGKINYRRDQVIWMDEEMWMEMRHGLTLEKGTWID